MVLTVVGDFEPEAILAEIKKRLKDNEARGEITRIYPEEKLEINKKYAEEITNSDKRIHEIYNEIKKK